MKRRRLGSAVAGVAILSTLTLPQGCSDIIGATRSQPIEEQPSRRSWGRMLDDQSIETKALVNIRKADERLEVGRR